MKIKALFISDVHLGSKGSRPDLLLKVLKKYEPEYLFIVGDFIDGWKLQRRHYWTQQETNVIRKILSYTKRDVNVVYVIGNHDDFLRMYDDMSFGNLDILEEIVYDGYFIVHGDHYDGVVKLQWLAKIGSWGYETALFIDRVLRRMGMKKSLSYLLKTRVKDAVKFVTNFESELVKQAKLRGCKGVICGHIHKPENKYIDDIHYLNTGDWIENFSYVIQDYDGNFEVRRVS